MDIQKFTEKFAAKLTVSDGAWGTEMQKLGLAAGACPELWNTENPDAIMTVAKSYVDAGSNVIISNTFGANKFVLEKHGAADRVAELAEAGAAISRKAADSGSDVCAFASMGPTGKIVMMGEVDPEEIFIAFCQQAKAMEAGGADAIVIETMTELDEVELAVRAIGESTALPCVISMTFDSGPDKTATMMGASPADVIEKFTQPHVAAVGANCGLGPENYIKVVELYRSATDKPIWVKANAGLPQVIEGRQVFPLDADGYATYVKKLAAAGANFIGGCCGTSPAHIAAVRKAADSLT